MGHYPNLIWEWCMKTTIHVNLCLCIRCSLTWPHSSTSSTPSSQPSDGKTSEEWCWSSCVEILILLKFIMRDLSSILGHLRLSGRRHLDQMKSCEIEMPPCMETRGDLRVIFVTWQLSVFLLLPNNIEPMAKYYIRECVIFTLLTPLFLCRNDKILLNW